MTMQLTVRETHCTADFGSALYGPYLVDWNTLMILAGCLYD